MTFVAGTVLTAAALNSELAAKLDISGDDNQVIHKGSPRIALRDTGANETVLFIDGGNNQVALSATAYTAAVASMGFYTGNVERMRIDATGLITGSGSLGAWSSFTPLISGTGWSVGTGATIQGKVCRLGKIAHWRIEFVLGSTGIGSGSLFVAMPYAVAGWHASTGTIYDTSIATFYKVTGRRNGNDIEVMYQLSTQALQGVTSSAPITLASGDVLEIGGTYEMA